MANARHTLGVAAEDAAARWLIGQGWSLVARRLRNPSGGEVDLVMRDPAGILVAIEVKARRTVRTGSAVGSVDELRVSRLRRTLASHAASAGIPHGGLRVDVVTLEPAETTARWRMRRVPGIG
jgi:putative endonuclease